MKKKLLLTAALLTTFSMAFSQKVFMTGDSHVSAKVYAEKVGEILQEVFPDLQFSYWGKAGAGIYTFNDSPSMMQRIYDADPDILIVHLGTNGCYRRAFVPEDFQRDLSKFYDNINTHLPDAQVIFVTPFYNKNKAKGTGKWQVNHNTRLCSDEFVKFGENHENVFIVDNNAEYGMVFLEQPGMIREDYVHLSIKGYQTLGEQVADSILEIDEIWEPYDEPYDESEEEIQSTGVEFN